MIKWAIIILVLFSGCTAVNRGETGLKQQMEDAEQYFSKSLSSSRIADVYPNMLAVEEGKVAENWPVFYNATGHEIQARMEVQCDKEFSIEGSTGYFAVPPKTHRSFAVKISATKNTGKGTAFCKVTFIEEGPWEMLAETFFTATVK